MTITQDFFISILQLVDDDLLCSIQTSDENLMHAMNQMKNVKIIGWSADIILSMENKRLLIKHVMSFNTEERINYFLILKDDKIIFISYDGFEIGTIASSITLPDIFISKFVKTGICWVAENIDIYM